MKLLFTYFLTFLSVLWARQAQAQEICNFGARSASMGHAAVTLADVWALSNNPAGMAGLQEPQLGLSVESRFGMAAFTTVALQAVYPTQRHGTYGLSFSRFGDALFSFQHAGLGVAHRLGQFSLGAKADVWQAQVEGYGSRKTVALSAGVRGEVVPTLYFGAYAYNLNQAKLASYEDERLPTIMKAGLSYHPSPRLLLAVETEKSIDFDADFKAGVEYTLIKEKFLDRKSVV